MMIDASTASSSPLPQPFSSPSSPPPPPQSASSASSSSSSPSTTTSTPPGIININEMMLLNETTQVTTTQSTTVTSFYSNYEQSTNCVNCNITINNNPIDNSSDLFNSISSTLFKFKDQYSSIHGYLSLCICFFGTVTNILNIIVLTRKELLSATNNILTGLAVADMLVMMDYIPFAIHHYIQVHQSADEIYSYGWTMFTLFHAHFTLVVHSISTWLTVLLAVWRYLSVRFPTQSRGWCTMSNARWLIVATYICIPIFFVPTYLTFTVKDNGAGGFKIDWSDISVNHNESLKRINFWVFSVGTKLVPCILLTYLSWALIHAVLEADKRKRRLKENCYNLASSSGGTVKSEYSEDSLTVCPPLITNHNNNNNQFPGGGSPTHPEVNPYRKVKLNPSSTTTTINGTSTSTSTSSIPTIAAVITSPSITTLQPFQPQTNVKSVATSHHQMSTSISIVNSGSSAQSDRTTRMLLSILLLFLATEFPTGFIALLSGIFGDSFFHAVYYPLGDILDTLALINSAVNFILYCTMSEQFRHTFAKLFFL